MLHHSHQFGQVAANNDFVLILDDAELDTLDLLADDDEIIFLDVDDSDLSPPCHKNDITFDFYAPVSAHIPSISDDLFAYDDFEQCLNGIMEDFPQAICVFDDDCVRVWDYVYREDIRDFVRTCIATIENDLFVE